MKVWLLYLKMEAVYGRMMRFSKEDKNLLAFISLDSNKQSYCTNALVLIPGLNDGMMSLNYTASLQNALLKLDYSLVQLNLSSSFNQFGFSSLEQDKQELETLVKFLKEEHNFKKVVLLGHSTGCQDSVYFIRYSTLSLLIDGVILQGAISDRDDIMTLESTPSMLTEAKELQHQGKERQILTQFHCGAPITAERYLSLAGRLTPDDMFSVDLSVQELSPILSSIHVPILLCFSEQDEYVSNMEEQRSFAERMVSVLKTSSPVVELFYLPGDHGLTVQYQSFIEFVSNFIEKNLK